MKKDGIDLGKNQTILLKKIEELTLFAIKQNNRIEEQSGKIAELEMRLMSLEKKKN